MSGRLSPAGVLKGLLEDGRRGSDGTLGGGGARRLSGVAKREGRGIDPKHSANMQLRVRGDEAGPSVGVAKTAPPSVPLKATPWRSA